MLADIPAGLVGTGGAAGILAVAVWLILTGRLIPRTTHEDRIGDKDKQIAWLLEENAAKSAEAKIRTEQVNKLMSNSDLSLAILNSIAKTAGRDADVAS
ncbi:hypothetical protein [Melissospora conviva]|uniref:hypothetical protein n=1 Tax=Melissospora conviva TaxID=3388432 RepID=UPI003C249610